MLDTVRNALHVFSIHNTEAWFKPLLGGGFLLDPVTSSIFEYYRKMLAVNFIFQRVGFLDLSWSLFFSSTEKVALVFDLLFWLSLAWIEDLNYNLPK